MRQREVILFYLLVLSSCAICWVPPGMSERDSAPAHEHTEDSGHHDHSDNVDVADVVLDEEHLSDDLGGIYTEKELEEMGTDEKVFTWFNTHDWDLNEHLDGLELLKALSHDHNYHHPDNAEEENIAESDSLHDPAQHTAAAERQRFRRTVKIVDSMLEEDDSNKDGEISFAEFMSAFHGGRLDGLKVKKVGQDQ